MENRLMSAEDKDFPMAADDLMTLETKTFSLANQWSINFEAL